MSQLPGPSPPQVAKVRSPGPARIRTKGPLDAVKATVRAVADMACRCCFVIAAASGSGSPSLQSAFIFHAQLQEADYQVSPSTPLLSTAIEENGWVCGELGCVQQHQLDALHLSFLHGWSFCRLLPLTQPHMQDATAMVSWVWAGRRMCMSRRPCRSGTLVM